MLSGSRRLIPRLNRISAAVTARVAHSNNSRLACLVVPTATNMINFRPSSTSAGPKDAKTDAEEEAQDKAQGESSRSEVAKFDYDQYDDYEPRTAGEAVGMWTVALLRLALLLGGLGCIFVLGRELFPGRLSPYSLFSEAFDVVKVNDEVCMLCCMGSFIFCCVHSLVA
jgi:hypothetical protein